MILKSDAKFEEKLTCCLENDMTNLANFHQSTRKSQKWNFDEILLSKVENVWASKFTEKLCVMTMNNDTKIEEERTCRFKIDMRNFTNFDLSTRKSKKFVLIGSLWPKHILFELRKYRGLIFHDSEELCTFWRKTDLWFEKRFEKFGKFSPEHLKVWEPFVQSRKGMTLKFAEELRVMTMKNNAKFEEELTCHFKTDMRNLTNFDLSTQKSKKIAL